MSVILDGTPFDYEKVRQSSTVEKALQHEECGITSFVYEERRPFDYDAFMDWLENDYPDTLIRAKGYIWFADDDIYVQLFEQAGRNASVTEVSNWIASFRKKKQEQIFKDYPKILEDWDEQYGDRLNQIVFIGKGYDEQQLIAKLNQCIHE